MKSKKSKILQVESIRIGLSSSEQIKQWAERTLPNGKIIGQITSSQTVNYKTLKPEKGGLFCERIFGPIKDFECACGKKKAKVYQRFCSECDVEFTSSTVRRHRLGYISLVSPVTHVWYLKGRPSYISILLDIPKKKIEAITYCTEIIDLNRVTEEIDTKNSGTFPHYYSISSQHCSWEIQEDWNYFLYFMTAPKYSNDRLIQKKFIQKENITRSGNTQLGLDESKALQRTRNSARNSCVLGAEAIYNLLSNLDFPSLDRELRIQLFFINEDLNDLETELKNLENQGYILFDKEQYQLKKFLFRQLQLLIYRRAKKLRRLKLVRHFRRTKARAEWMVLSIIPVLPPDLRPIIQLDGDQVAVSDLNKLYQKVLFRNNRIKKQSSSKSDESKYAQRLLQEAVDALIENGKAGSDPICAANERPLKSLSDMLKGKKGRFRQNLLGKRVDYSGRSVIVVGPNLKLHECGLPKELAIELFQPFLIRRLMCNKIVRTIVGAKRLIQKKDPIIWRILEQVLQNHPVLLNRAPTLHRVGIQAFQPKLVEGRAILLHPLVCNAFNADFDGDQMAVHVPLCFEARAEAWMLMWSRNNLLSTATGQPLVIPSQDMVLGCYYLTTDTREARAELRSSNFKKQKQAGNHFQTIDDVLKNYNQDKLKVHSPVWIKWDGKVETNIDTENPIEIQLRKFGKYTNIYLQYRQDFDEYGIKKIQYIRTTPGRTLLNSIIQEKPMLRN